ncbi:DBH-like monooxygenase protein 2 homolog, partial [Centruroides vittatus]|uniref:DBH-like monooxygenase protein 2 homolog n=1 Tax=Centruroides vittatus TaxID=120091 RepID=UPI00350F1C10
MYRTGLTRYERGEKTSDTHCLYQTARQKLETAGGSRPMIGGRSNSSSILTFLWLQDRYARGKFLPEIDDHQDWELLWFQQTDTHTKFSFKRFLIPCDSQDLHITDETTRLIFAYNNENPGSTGEISYHSPKNRGTKSVTLKKYERGILREDPSELYHWEVTHSN